VGRILEGFLVTSPLILIFGAGPIEAAQSIKNTDWEMLERSVRSVPVIVRNRCKTIAELHWHSHLKDPARQDFWRAMVEAFSSHR